MKNGLVLALTLTGAIAGPALAAGSGDDTVQAASMSSNAMVLAAPAEPARRESTTVVATSEEGWRFSVTPIAFWNFNAKGSTTLLGHTRYNNASPSDVQNNLAFAGGFGLELGKGAWTWSASGSFLKWELEDVRGSVADTFGGADLTFKYSTGQLGFGYRLPVARGPKAPNVQLLGFVRSSRMKFEIQDSATGGGTFDKDKSITWTDPMIGVSVMQPIKGSFFFLMSSDIGGFGISENQSQLTWDFMTGLGYHWQWSGWGLGIAGGYKAQQFIINANNKDATPQDFTMDQRFQGPILAATLTF